MGTYEIPRNVKGEGRILYVFSMKALMYTAGTGFIGLLFYYLFTSMGLQTVGIVIAAIFAGIGFIIGTFKMPEIPSLKFTKQTSGQNIEDIIKRAIKFYSKKSKIYTYTKEEIKK